MAKKVTGQIKLQIPAGKANPAPPVGPALGQHGVNIMQFCKEFNAATQAQAKDDLIIPVVITVYADRSFSFILKTPPASILLLKAAKVAKGAGSKRLSAAALDRLHWHDWPGNVRELGHVLERASILAGDSPVLEAEHIRLRAVQRTNSGHLRTP